MYVHALVSSWGWYMSFLQCDSDSDSSNFNKVGDLSRLVSISDKNIFKDASF